MDNDDLFPKPRGSKELRALLMKIDGDDEQLNRSPLWQNGYAEGFEAGRLEAEEESKCLIRALMKLYDRNLADNGIV